MFKIDNSLNNKYNALSHAFAIVEFSLDGKVLNANDNYLDLFQYSDSEIKQINYKHLLSNDLFTKIRSGKPVSETLLRAGSRGNEIWTQSTFTPIPDKAGHIKNVIEYSVDVTESASKSQLYEQMVSNMPINTLVANTEGIIYDMNPAAEQTLKTIEHLLPTKVDKILGNSYDIFHKAPEHQRKLLADPRNLPHQTVIDVGDEKLDLLVSPLYSKSGKYIGPMVTWSIVTEKIRLEQEGIRSRQMIENLPINVMLADLDGKIISLNKSSKTTLKSIEHLLPIPSDKILGESYDIFHKNPIHQREILANPDNLPHQAIIDVGDEKLDLLISPLFDMNGNYEGPMVTWSVVTEKYRLAAKNEENKERLESTVLGLTSTANEDFEDLHKYINSVATASEEMVASISEISSKSSQAAGMTQDAVARNKKSSEILEDLRARSDEIGEIIKVVVDIASQTNLLALNATIEAARAGEMGRGFSVVANEVKELANRTQDATKDISSKIAAIQNSTQETQSFLGATTESIGTIDAMMTSIASAIEEQSAVTSEIGHSMNSAQEKINNATENVVKIEDSVKFNISQMQ